MSQTLKLTKIATKGKRSFFIVIVHLKYDLILTVTKFPKVKAIEGGFFKIFLANNFIPAYQTYSCMVAFNLKKKINNLT